MKSRVRSLFSSRSGKQTQGHNKEPAAPCISKQKGLVDAKKEPSSKTRKAHLTLRPLTKPRRNSASRPGPSLRRLVDKRDWDQVRERLAAPASASLRDELQTSTDFMGQTVLHDIVRGSHPPLDIVTSVVAICPNLSSQADCLGRTALHVAAAGCAGSQIILALLSSSSLKGGRRCKLAAKKDCQGKTPLHLMCEALAIAAAEDKKKHKKGSVKDVSKPHDTEEASSSLAAMKLLLAECPHAVNEQDKDGITPLERAKMGGVERSIIRLLKKTSGEMVRTSTHKDYSGKILSPDANCQGNHVLEQACIVAREDEEQRRARKELARSWMNVAPEGENKNGVQRPREEQSSRRQSLLHLPLEIEFRAGWTVEDDNISELTLPGQLSTPFINQEWPAAEAKCVAEGQER